MRMNLKRIFALVLALCMILPYGLISPASAEEAENDASGSVGEALSFTQVDPGELDVDLTNVENTAAADLALEQEMVDENGMVEVIIVMEGESVVQTNSSAVLDADSQRIMRSLEEEQVDLISVIEETVLGGETLEVTYSYTWLLNGVAAEVPYEAIHEIAAIDGIKQVIIAPTYEIFAADDVNLNTISDGVMVGRESTWADGYTGQGIKIAIIDTGLDTDHQNFQALSQEVLTEDSATAEDVAAALGSLNASVRYPGLTIDDVYYSNKVVFGFNYSDNSIDITHENDSQGDHGTHVAGIAAANKVEASEVVGVAPDAQLYIMKVFGYNRSGSASDIIAALEDALILGVDVVNMSLGSNAGFTSAADAFIDSIYARVAETNTVLSVSAGNNYTSGYGNTWGTNANTTSNPDNAVIGEPGAYNNVLSVASVENWKIQRYYIDVSGYQMAFTETSSSYGLPLVSSLTESYGIVYVPGYGTAEDFEDCDVTGKIALVQRGVESFATKCQNAADAGAIACFIFNNTTGEFYMDLTGCEAGIPCVSITMADGEYIISMLESSEDVAISFPQEQAAIPSVSAYQMSEFSSWGLAPDLSLEPDITAPGGNIYSTLDGGEYGLMSGTSMAAPNITGLSALVMQYAKENFDDTTDYRTLVQNLLVSTSAPLEYEDGLYYSPRKQGSGLANAYNAVNTNAYLSVEGMDSPKAELGEDPERVGSYSFTYNVTNFGNTNAYYELSTVVQSEGYETVEGYEGVYFMSSTPVALDAATAESSDAMVLTHDVDDSGTSGSHDAYWIYRAAIGEPEKDSWTSESFRYDLDGNDAVTTEDVQNYLNALVGLDYEGDVADEVLCVEAGETVSVGVSVALAESGRTYLDTYYTNGGYVEGFTFLNAVSEGGVDLSIPYLAFYGSWDDAPIIDDGDYWDLLNAEEGEVVGNQYWNTLFSNFYGYESYVYPGYNVYVEEEFDPAHIALSPNNDGYFDTVDDIYTSLLRNAAEMTYRYTNTDTGEVYYEQTVLNVNKSVYYDSYGQIIPNVYSWYDGEILMWDWTKSDGSELENGTNLLLEIEAVGAYEGATPDIWSVPVFIDLEGPALLSAVKTTDDDGVVTLELTFRDNHYVSAVALMNSNATDVYYLEGLEDPEADEDGYRYYTASFDVTDISGKVMILLCDYAMNQSAFGLNVAGEGTPYGELVAYQYNFNDDINGWISFDPEGVLKEEEVSEEETEPTEETESTEEAEDTEPAEPEYYIEQTQITMDEMGFACAEYVNGFVFAQTEEGALYGFRYSDMLLDTFDLNNTYITQLENVYQDLAYNYKDGQLYGLFTYEYDGYATSELYTINIREEYVDANTEETVSEYEEVWAFSRGGIFGLGLAIRCDGTFFILGIGTDGGTELWTSYQHASYGTLFKKLMNIDVPTDYLQSMTWDHNEETLYWASFNATGIFSYDAGLYEIDVDEKTCTYIGELAGETCAMFAPLTEKASVRMHRNVPTFATETAATPTLRKGVVTMNVGASETLIYDLIPWYSDYTDVVWSSSNPAVASVDQNGTVTAVSTGFATITVANAVDATKFTSCEVQVTALDLVLEGVITAQGAGVGNAGGTSIYRYEMVDGVASISGLAEITASEELDFGLDMATSVLGRGYLWACEYNNTGMIYQIDAQTGEVVDVFQPIDGDMMFGMTYSEENDTFACIMNMYLFADMELSHEEEQKMIDSLEGNTFNYHRLNLLPYLLEAEDGFITNEYGNGASSEIVMCGITTIADDYTYVDTNLDYLGNSTTYTANYTADQTLVVLDNVGRLWYIDEIWGMTKSGNNFVKGESSISESRNGVLSLAYEDGTYSVFCIRTIEETQMTDMFRSDLMPRITYHFSDIEFAGYDANGAAMFAISMYDYWNNGTTNELYLYVAPVTEYDAENGTTRTLAEDRLYDLGDTGRYNIIASIHSATITGGVDEEVEAVETMSINALGIAHYAE